MQTSCPTMQIKSFTVTCLINIYWRYYEYSKTLHVGLLKDDNLKGYADIETWSGSQTSTK